MTVVVELPALPGKLLDDAHPAWALVPDVIRSAGQIAYGILHG